MEKVKLEDYLPAVKHLTGVDLSKQDKQALTAVFTERHFKKLDHQPDGVYSFLEILRLIEANRWPIGTKQIDGKKEMTILPSRSAPYFPKTLKPAEKGKREYLAECTKGFIAYLEAQGIADNDSRHLAGRVVAMVYEDWYPRHKNGAIKGLGGERNFILRRIKHLLGEAKKPG